MKSSPRTAAALGALVALCVAGPASATPGEPREHAPNEHATQDHGHKGDDTTAPAPETTGATDPAAPADSAAPAAPAAPATCDYPAARRVFARWHDRKNYVLTQNGGLEQGDAGWTLADGATVVDGNEPFLVNNAADAKSLSLPAGSSATSPATCFEHQDSTFRLVANGPAGSRLKVEVLYTSAKGKNASRVAGKLRGGGEWRPSKKLSLAIGRAKGKGRLAGTTGTVSFRFTPVGAGDWQIDDLHLDPRARH